MHLPRAALFSSEKEKRPEHEFTPTPPPHQEVLLLEIKKSPSWSSKGEAVATSESRGVWYPSLCATEWPHQAQKQEQTVKNKLFQLRYQLPTLQTNRTRCLEQCVLTVQRHPLSASKCPSYKLTEICEGKPTLPLWISSLIKWWNQTHTHTHTH